jgi:hypothetical protein
MLMTKTKTKIKTRQRVSKATLDFIKSLSEVLGDNLRTIHVSRDMLQRQYALGQIDMIREVVDFIAQNSPYKMRLDVSANIRVAS